MDKQRSFVPKNSGFNNKRSRGRIKISRNINVFLLVLIFLYLIIELVFNYVLFTQMSVATSTVKIDVVETFAKIVSGIGIALFITKARSNFAGVTFMQTLRLFFISLLIGIPASFIIQKSVVNFLVWQADDDTKLSALLTAQAAATIVPVIDNRYDNGFFDYDELIEVKDVSTSAGYLYAVAKSGSVTQAHDDYLSQAQLCTQNEIKPIYQDIYSLDNRLSKGLFSFVMLDRMPQYENLHLQAIKSFHLCMNKTPFYAIKASHEGLLATHLLNPVYYKLYFTYNDYLTKLYRLPRNQREAAHKKIIEGFATQTQMQGLDMSRGYRHFHSHKDIYKFLENQGVVWADVTKLPNTDK